MTDETHSNVLAITALLLINGLLVAVTLAISKAAQAGGLSPIAYGFWMTLGGGALLTLGALYRRPKRAMPKQRRYWVISGLLSIALPQLLIFIAVGKIGAGLAGVAFALPTLSTWAMARWMGIEGRSRTRMIGAVLGATGATLLMLPSTKAIPTHAAPWMLLVVTAPVIIAGGNIYRRVAWPDGARPIELAAGMLMTAAALFLLVAAAFQTNLAFWQFDGVTPLMLAQMVFAAVQFLAYFELQKRAKPVVFSLIGQVALIFGMVIGALLLGETYSSAALGSVALMMVGLFCIMLGRPDSMKPVQTKMTRTEG